MGRETAQGERSRFTFKVSGMSCAHCERRVEAAVKGIEGIESAMADARLGELRVVCAQQLEYEPLFSVIDERLRSAG